MSGEWWTGHRGERFERWTMTIGVLGLILLVLVTGGVGVVAAQEAESPTAKFTYSPSSPLPDDRVEFSAAGSSASSGEIVRYTWEIERYYPSFSDTASGSSFVYEFDTYGEYEITLIVEDINGSTDAVTQTVTVAGDGPTADIRISPSEPSPDTTVTFDATGSTAPSGGIVDYEWRYETNRGSTRSTSGTSFSYEYSSYGSYDVELTVTDNGGATDTVTKTVEVGGEGPTAAFSFTPSDPVADEVVTFDASASTAPSGEIVDYR